MVERLEVYKCEVCGNIVEVLHGGAGQLVCCGQPMKLQIEKTEDQGKEKHVPVVENIEKGMKVMVGSVPHPMEESHFIEWVEIDTEDGVLRKYLKPGVAPEAEFECATEEKVVREYCSIHGLWKK